MKKEVTIKIKGVQKYPEGEKVESVTETFGEYYERNGSRYIKYEEQMEDFPESNKCLLKVRKDAVEITKKGLVNSQMIFEENKLNNTLYRTPFGEILMGTKAEHIQILEEENTLAIQIRYELFAEEEHLADCNIRIMIKSKG